MACSTKKWH